MTKKRKSVLSWDEYYMSIALLSGKRSKDPSTQVGACIVSPENKIIGVGYNGFPWGCSDDILPWSSEGDYLDTKNPYVCHAELNAVLNSIKNLKGCRIYVSVRPCNECAKVIIQAGITEVIYLSDQGKGSDSAKAAGILFQMAHVKLTKFLPRRKTVNIKFIED